MNKPKPIELKILQGNPGKRPIPNDAPRADGQVPKKPRHLTGEAGREWKRVTEELQRIGVLSSVDRAALEVYCKNYARWREAENELEVNGLTVESPNGYKIASPYVAISNQCVGYMHKFLTEYGLTASSRAKVRKEKPSKKSIGEKLKEAVG